MKIWLFAKFSRKILSITILKDANRKISFQESYTN